MLRIIPVNELAANQQDVQIKWDAFPSDPQGYYAIEITSGDYIKTILWRINMRKDPRRRGDTVLGEKGAIITLDEGDYSAVLMRQSQVLGKDQALEDSAAETLTAMDQVLFTIPLSLDEDEEDENEEKPTYVPAPIPEARTRVPLRAPSPPRQPTHTFARTHHTPPLSEVMPYTYVRGREHVRAPSPSRSPVPRYRQPSPSPPMVPTLRGRSRSPSAYRPIRPTALTPDQDDVIDPFDERKSQTTLYPRRMGTPSPYSPHTPGEAPTLMPQPSTRRSPYYAEASALRGLAGRSSGSGTYRQTKLPEYLDEWDGAETGDDLEYGYGRSYGSEEEVSTEPLDYTPQSAGSTPTGWEDLYQ